MISYVINVCLFNLKVGKINVRVQFTYNFLANKRDKTKEC